MALKEECDSAKKEAISPKDRQRPLSPFRERVLLLDLNLSDKVQWSELGEQVQELI